MTIITIWTAAPDQVATAVAEFIIRAWLAGMALAAVAAPLGCFVVWRRLAYFGDTLSHSALLGVAIGILTGMESLLAVTITVVAMALLVVVMQQQRILANDTLLGILAHSGLAIGLVAISLSGNYRVDLMAFLFGDILSVDRQELTMILAGAPIILGVIAWLWRPLLFATMHEEMAAAEGTRVLALKIALMLLLAIIVAVAMKIVGILLITAMLILPAASARAFAKTPELMVLFAALAGGLSVTLGLGLSVGVDTPAGPSIVVAALAIFIASQLFGSLNRLRTSESP